MNQNVRPGLVFLAALTIAPPWLASGGTVDESAETREADPTLLTRVHRLERALAEVVERLDRLASSSNGERPDAGHLAPKAPPEAAARIETLEKQVAEMALRLARLDPAPGGSVPSTAEGSSAAPGSERASQGVMPSPTQPAFGAQPFYLPSHSWAGGKLHYGGPEFKIVTHGFVDLEYVDSGSDGAARGVPSFDNHHSNVFFDANLRSNLSAHLEIEIEHSGDLVELDQGYVKWGIADWLALDLGRFYTPFGIERFVWYSPTNQLVSRPAAFRDIVPGNFYANGIRASGILLQREQPRFTYEFSVSNGLGDPAADNRRGSRQNRDNNSSRAYSGRVAGVVWPWAEVGASYHGQRYDAAGQLDLEFAGFDLSTRWNGFELRYEYVNAFLERPLPASRLDQSGWYAQLSYTFDWDREALPALSLVTRYDRVDLDRELRGSDDRSFWSLGLNLNLYRHFRFKTEYQFARERGARKDNNTFFQQFVVDF
jgi:hypothetical protein